MFLNRKIPSPCKSVVAKVDFANKNNPNAIVEEICLNGVVKKGKLRSVKALEVVNQLYNLYAAYPLEQGILIFRNNSLSLFAGTMRFMGNLTFQEPHFKYVQRDKLLLVSDSIAGTYRCNGISMLKHCNEYFTSMAFSNERLIGVRDGKLYVSERGNSAEWREHLQLPADIVAVEELGDDVIAVGAEIYKIQLSDSLENTKVSCLARNVGKVYANTVCMVGNNLYFLTNKGLYCLAQNKLSSVCRDIDFAEDNSKATAVCHKDEYWLYYTNAENQSLVVSMDSSGQYTFYDLPDVTQMAANDGKIVILLKASPHIFGNKPANMFWKSKEYDFGDRFVKKHFRKLHVVTKNGVEVHLVTDTERRIIHVPAGAHRIRLSGTFGAVSVEIHSTEEACVEKLAIEVQEYGREVTHGNI